MTFFFFNFLAFLFFKFIFNSGFTEIIQLAILKLYF